MDATAIGQSGSSAPVLRARRRHRGALRLVFGQGEWASWKHGARSGPGWKKLHLGVDSGGFIVAADVTDAHVPDGAMVPDLLRQLEGPLLSFTADGADDGRPVYEAVLAAGPAPRIVVPPPKTAVVTAEPSLDQRDAAFQAMERDGRRRWKKEVGYHQQARAENTIGRYKQTFGRSPGTSGRRAAEGGLGGLRRAQPYARTRRIGELRGSGRLFHGAGGPLRPSRRAMHQRRAAPLRVVSSPSCTSSSGR